MRSGFIITALFIFAVAVVFPLNAGEEDEARLSPLTGDVQNSQTTVRPKPDSTRLTPPSNKNGLRVAGGLYGTDGANLYLIDKSTGGSRAIRRFWRRPDGLPDKCFMKKSSELFRSPQAMAGERYVLSLI